MFAALGEGRLDLEPLNIFFIVFIRLKTLFLRCFNDGHQFPHKRPTAEDWVRVLEEALNEVISCGKIDSHHYSLSYGQCYWCERAKTLNFDLFPGNVIVPSPVPSPPTPSPQPIAQPKPPSSPKIIVSKPPIIQTPQPLVQKWPRRKLLIGLGAGLVTVGGLKIFAQPRSGNIPNQDVLTTSSPIPSPTPRSIPSPSPTRSPIPTPRSFAKPTPFTEKLPNGLIVKMVGLPAGKFLMGSPTSDPDAYDDEFPQHEVNVPSFAIGKYQVTQAQWQAVMGKNPSRFDDNSQNPVENVSWDDC